MIRLALGILGVAALAAGADALWYELGIEHTMLAGVIHGAVLLAAAGAVVGLASGRAAPGILAGSIAGLGGALGYYTAAPLTGGVAALGVGWVVVWLLLAVLDGRALRSPPRSWGGVLARGLGAALSSGIAFFALVDTLWGPESEGGRSYLVQLGAWMLAWAPGLLCLALPLTPGAERRTTGAVE